MLQFLCDDCKRPIDPAKDNYLEVPQMVIMFHGKGGRAVNLHFCQRDHFISWLKKNGEPSSIISAQNTLGPAL